MGNFDVTLPMIPIVLDDVVCKGNEKTQYWSAITVYSVRLQRYNGEKNHLKNVLRSVSMI